MSNPARVTAALRFCGQSLPTVAVAAVTAALAPFGVLATAGLAALVGAGTWAGALRRRSTLLPVPASFIGS